MYARWVHLCKLEMSQYEVLCMTVHFGATGKAQTDFELFICHQNAY